MSNLTAEEKIDYIFEELKSQKRGRTFKIIFKLTIIGLLIFAYFNFVQGLNKDEVIKNFSSAIGEIVKPITKDLVKEMTEESTSSLKEGGTDLMNEILKNKDLLNKLNTNNDY